MVNMFKKIGVSAILTSDPDVIANSPMLILPGVGSFDTGMRNLAERKLIGVLNNKVLSGKTPILGVCLGMQLMTKGSEEGELPGLGWIDAKTVRFNFEQSGHSLKVPHMGWNTVRVCHSQSILFSESAMQRFYFVHSYHLVCSDPGNIAAETDYGYAFTSVVARDNIFGVQFHPEKSHKFGMKLLGNFARLGQSCQPGASKA